MTDRHKTSTTRKTDQTNRKTKTHTPCTLATRRSALRRQALEFQADDIAEQLRTRQIVDLSSDEIQEQLDDWAMALVDSYSDAEVDSLWNELRAEGEAETVVPLPDDEDGEGGAL